MTTWRTCPWCPPGDNRWPEEAFTAARGAFSDPPCNACFEARYPRRWTECSGCGARMRTRGKGAAVCRWCREHPGQEPPPCTECGKERKGDEFAAGICHTCRCRQQYRKKRAA